jgi:hypothetical protein
MENYEALQIKVTAFDSEDVIATSPVGTNFIPTYTNPDDIVG